MSSSSETQRPEDDGLDAIDKQISFVLDHPGMSAWLKCALRGALPRDPIVVLNDLEILNLILRRRSAVLISRRDISSGYGQTDG